MISSAFLKRTNFIFGFELDDNYSEQATDINQDNIVNILDVIQVVSEILGTTFGQSVIWLEENFPELKTKERLSNLNKEQYFTK